MPLACFQTGKRDTQRKRMSEHFWLAHSHLLTIRVTLLAVHVVRLLRNGTIRSARQQTHWASMEPRMTLANSSFVVKSLLQAIDEQRSKLRPFCSKILE